MLCAVHSRVTVFALLHLGSAASCVGKGVGVGSFAQTQPTLPPLGGVLQAPEPAVEPEEQVQVTCIVHVEDILQAWTSPVTATAVGLHPPASVEDLLDQQAWAPREVRLQFTYTTGGLEPSESLPPTGARVKGELERSEGIPWDRQLLLFEGGRELVDGALLSVYVQTHTHAHSLTRTHRSTHTRTHVHTHTCTHTCTHTRAHTHTHTLTCIE